MRETFRLTVDGVPRTVSCAPTTTLLHVLRGTLGLLGTRFGCGEGSCGACVVLVDGSPTPSCDLPVWSASGRRVDTVEGLGSGGQLHPVQRAILAEQAAQCGYCISGIQMSAAALLAENPAPDEATVAAALDRHLCRCGVQRRIVRAVVRAAHAEGRQDERAPGA